MAGRSDADSFRRGGRVGWALLTENVSDFARLCRIPTAVAAVAGDQLDDRLVYLELRGQAQRQ